MKQVAAKTPKDFDVKTFLKNLTTRPGIYQMFDVGDHVLYIGKARNLKKRVSSYFRRTGLSIKTNALVKQIHHVDVIVTNTENEALLLENTLIKKYKPRYNILFRDDKSYPYLVLWDHPHFPRLDFYRGIKQSKGRFFGPYPSTVAVRETLNLLQKLFRIRQCDDVFFRNRTRPCLQYQMKRCTAPCVNFIDEKSYREDIRHAVLFLEGKNQTVIAELIRRMEAASTNQDYEDAVRYRDQIANLRQIQQQQAVLTQGGDADAIALAIAHGSVCLQVVMIRGGRLLGSKSYFPALSAISEPEEILAAFLSHYYLDEETVQDIPRQIIVSHKLSEQEWMARVLTDHAKHSVILTHRPQSDRARWLRIASQNAEHALAAHLADRASIYQRLEALKDLLGLDTIPHRLECFDISHTQGEATVASCVVFDEQGHRKSDYRRFNIQDITPGDDYAAMRQALMRHYTALKSAEDKLPDVLLIDGGKGQLKQAEEVLEELQVVGVVILAIAKGPTRKAGLETVFISGKSSPLLFPEHSLALHLLQQIRDEAHRFAITGHRGQRAKSRNKSILENIPGIGTARRRELLRQFGGLQELKRASAEDLVKVPGINKSLAERILAALREN